MLGGVVKGVWSLVWMMMVEATLLALLLTMFVVVAILAISMMMRPQCVELHVYRHATTVMATTTKAFVVNVAHVADY